MNRRTFAWIMGLSACFTCGFAYQSVVHTAPNAQPAADSGIIKAFVMGKFYANTDPRFGIVPAAMSSKTMYLQKEVITAFQLMRREAMPKGIDLKIISGTRNFWEQKAIWDRKWVNNVNRFGTGIENAKHILLYSSMPGSSRHHWGTDIDINSLEPGYFRTGRGLAEITWLRNNANKYGFFEVYTPRKTGRLVGYEPEAWHWSYAPLSDRYLTYYLATVKPSDFSGFYGAELAAPIRIIEDYVKGIGAH